MREGVRWPALRDLAAEANLAEASLTEASLARIRALDPEIGAFLALGSPGAPPQRRLPLAGVPIAVKDNIAVQGLPLTCASRVLEGFVPTRDATAARRLLEAGAAIPGKTNMDEFAMGSSTEHSAFHPCRNPWDPERVPGGSSGGSAAAVAAGLVPAALGSDTGGSVRQPAAFCGTVGFKPSYGAVSRFGLVAYASSLDQIGILATRTDDALALFDLIRGPDGRDCTLVPRKRFERATPRRERAARERPARLGLVTEHRDHPLLEEAPRQALEQAARCARETGIEVEEISLPFLDETVIPAYYLTAAAEASSNLARFDGIRFGSTPDPSASRGDADSLVRAARARFGREVRLRILLGTFVLRAGYHDRYYARAQAARRRIASGLSAAFRRVDALLTPTTPTRAFPLGAWRDDPLRMKLADLFTVPANLAGLPAISLPAGLADGLPTAVQLVGPRFADHPLLDLAGRLEERLAFDPGACPMARRGPRLPGRGRGGKTGGGTP